MKDREAKYQGVESIFVGCCHAPDRGGGGGLRTREPCWRGGYCEVGCWCAVLAFPPRQVCRDGHHTMVVSMMVYDIDD